MTKIKLIPFYILLLYPLVGFISFSVFNSQPYYILTPFITIAFFASLKNDRILLPKYILFFGLFCITELFSKYFINQIKFDFDIALKRSSFFIITFLIFFIIENTKFTLIFIKRAISILKILLFVSAIVSIIQYFSPNFFFNTIREGLLDEGIIGYKRRISSIFSWGDNGYGLGLGVPVIFSILASVYLEKKKLLLLLTISVGIVVLLVQSRFAIINYIIVLIYVYRKFFTIRRITYGILILLAFGLVSWFLIDLIAFDFQYFFTNRVQSETYLSRIEAVYAFLDQFPESPLWGTGGVATEGLLEFYGRPTRIHNGYLAILYYYGIIGGLFYFSFLFMLIKKLYTTAKLSNYWGSFVAILCFLFTNLTLDLNHFIEPGIIFMMVFYKISDNIIKEKYALMLISNKRQQYHDDVVKNLKNVQ